MAWFNVYGALFVIGLMLPNIMYFSMQKESEKMVVEEIQSLELMEQIARFGCIIFMMMAVNGVCRGFYFPYSLAIYIIGNLVLLLLYWLCWLGLWKHPSLYHKMALAILPSLLFLFSSLIRGDSLLFISAILFAYAHIRITYQNGRKEQEQR